MATTHQVGKEEGNLTGGSSTGLVKSLWPTQEELNSAAITLASALDTIGVTKYGLIGGGAVSILSFYYGMRSRQTEDLDLIIQPTQTMTADLASRTLTTDETVKESFISKRDGYVDKTHVVVMRDTETIHILVEIFDWEVWPERRRYYNLEEHDNTLIHLSLEERDVPVLNAGWLLRQKILAYSQRQNRRLNDIEDIRLLRMILTYRNEKLTITDESEVEALEAVMCSDFPPDLQEIVQCEAIWPTT